MDNLLTEQNSTAKPYLFASNLSFLQESDSETSNKLATLIAFYDWPINILNLVELGGELDYIEMVVEFEKFCLDVRSAFSVYRVLN